MCQATLSFLQLSLGVLVPTLVAVYCWHPLPEEAAGSGTPTAASYLVMDRASHLQHMAAPHIVAARVAYSHAASWAQSAAAGTDRLLRLACQSWGGALARAAACWYLAALAWSLCKRLAGLPVCSL